MQLNTHKDDFNQSDDGIFWGWSSDWGMLNRCLSAFQRLIFRQQVKVQGCKDASWYTIMPSWILQNFRRICNYYTCSINTLRLLHPQGWLAFCGTNIRKKTNREHPNMAEARCCNGGVVENHGVWHVDTIELCLQTVSELNTSVNLGVPCFPHLDLGGQ